MKNIIATVLLTGFLQCEKTPNISCNEEFFKCAKECSTICHKTIKHAYEFGKCFTQCNQPCRKEYCKEARMVEVVDTEDLKSFTNKGVGVQVPLRARYYEKE